MKSIHLIFLVKILLISCYYVTADDPDPDPEPEPDVTEPELPEGYVEAEESDEPYDDECTSTGYLPTYNGMIAKSHRWQKFYVQIDPNYSKNDRNTINVALVKLQEVLPCVEFRVYKDNAKPSGDYISIVRGSNNGCNSIVGKWGGRQVINIQVPGCNSLGTILHEMCHALGLMHEHQRYDRDDYVIIHEENIESGKKDQFKRVKPNEFDPFGEEYNTRSIMHYGKTAFGKDNRITIEARDGGPVGHDDKLRQTDINKLKKMYEC